MSPNKRNQSFMPRESLQYNQSVTKVCDSRFYAIFVGLCIVKYFQLFFCAYNHTSTCVYLLTPFNQRGKRNQRVEDHRKSFQSFYIEEEEESYLEEDSLSLLASTTPKKNKGYTSTTTPKVNPTTPKGISSIYLNIITPNQVLAPVSAQSTPNHQDATLSIHNSTPSNQNTTILTESPLKPPFNLLLLL